MGDMRYVVSVETPDGEKIAGSTYGDEKQARREADKFLSDPAYERCTVWLTSPGGETQALTASE